MRTRKKNLPRRKKTPKKAISAYLIKSRWKTRAKTYDSYPYLLTVSFFRRNIFFNLSNHLGQTNFWTNAGRNHFQGRDKIDYMAVISMTEIFLRRIWVSGFNWIILNFKNYNRLNRAVKRGIKWSLKKGFQLKFISFSVKNEIAFNGCRRKKKRRR